MLPLHFQNAMTTLKKLEEQDRYLGMFVFGSAARDEVTEDSDLDVRVIVSENNACENVNQFFLNAIKIDITFHSIEQLAEQMEVQAKSNRIPMIAESIVVFDKTGELEIIKQKYLLHKPRMMRPEEYPFQQFLIRHATNKIERNLEKDPLAAMLAMSIGINDVLKQHYALNQKWWVSNKRILKDLEEWDPIGADLLKRFLSEQDVEKKFSVWQEFTDHLTKQMGGTLAKQDYFCSCETCQRDLDALNNLSL